MKYIALFLLALNFQPSVRADILQAPKGYQYALVTVLPAGPELTADQRAILAHAKEALESGLPALAETISGIVLSAQAASKSVLLESSAQLKAEVSQRLEIWRGRLPTERVHVNAYIVAWPSDRIPRIAQRIGPGFPLINLTTSSKAEVASVYSQVNAGVRAALSAQYNNGNRFQFAGAAFRVSLERNISLVSLQVFGGLNPGKNAFDNKSDEVEISRIEIPTAESINGHVPYAASVLLTMRQRLDQDAPTMNLDFGTFGDVAGTAATARGFQAFGEFQIFRNPLSADEGADCRFKEATPTLVGVLGPRATGIEILDKIAKGRDVQFRIFEMDINPVTGHIENMDVRMDLGILDCLSLNSVKRKFTDRADEALQNILKSFYKQNDLTDKLMAQLYGKS